MLNNFNYFACMQVKHSQKMTATPLLPWVVCRDNGEILTAHCTCVAGYIFRLKLYINVLHDMHAGLEKLALMLLQSYHA